MRIAVISLPKNRTDLSREELHHERLNKGMNISKSVVASSLSTPGSATALDKTNEFVSVDSPLNSTIPSESDKLPIQLSQHKRNIVFAHVGKGKKIVPGFLSLPFVIIIVSFYTLLTLSLQREDPPSLLHCHIPVVVGILVPTRVRQSKNVSVTDPNELATPPVFSGIHI